MAWLGILGLLGCEGEVEDEDLANQDLLAAVSYTGPDRFVVWQHNISWFSSASAAETAIKHAMTAHGRAPDIFMFQECGAPCICGADGRYNQTTGQCDSVGGPGVERALRSVGARDLYTFRRNGLRVVGFRSDRFDQIGGDFKWGARPSGGGNYATCATVSVGEQISVMLNDTLASPERQILVSTGHWFVGRDCACRQVHRLENRWKTAAVLRNSDAEEAGAYVDLHVFGGDWNAEPQTGLPTAYRVASATCEGLDLGGEHHTSTGGTEWTFCQGAGGVSSPTTCTNKKAVDYLWARNYNRAGITWSGSPDTDANYFNDHRAVRTVFTY